MIDRKYTDFGVRKVVKRINKTMKQIRLYASCGHFVTSRLSPHVE